MEMTQPIDSTQFTIINHVDESRQDNEFRTANDVYSTVDELATLFKARGCVYDRNRSRCENIILAQNEGKIPAEYIITFKGIDWDLKEGETHTLQDNIRLVDNRVVKGTLIFKSDNIMTGDFEIRDEKQLKTLLGVEYTKKTFVENLHLARKVGNYFPTCGEVIYCGGVTNLSDERVTCGGTNSNLSGEWVNCEGIDFNVPDGEVYTFADNEVSDGAKVSNGIVVFKGTMFVFGDAIGIANGPGSEATTSASTGKACAQDQAHAYAIKAGKSFALNDCTHGHADGMGTKSFGLKAGATLHLSNYATGYKCDGVFVENDGTCQVFALPGLNNAPPENSKEYLDFLHDLADLVNVADTNLAAECAFALGMAAESKLKAVIPTGDPKVDYLKLALKLGKKEAALELCHFLIQRCGFEYVESGWWRDTQGSELSLNKGKIYAFVMTDLNRGKFCHKKYQMKFSGTQADWDNMIESFKAARETGLIDKDANLGSYVKNYKENHERNNCTVQ